MSPSQAMERSYSTLKQMLREGRFAPGARLEANRIAEDLGVSMTPVRDVLHRLVGERLVEASVGDGFHVPRYSEAALRDLYEWHSALVLIAVRTARGPIAPRIAEHDADVATHAEHLFLRIAATAPNREIGYAIAAAGDRLHPFRVLEQDVLQTVMGELDGLLHDDGGQSQAIRRYHVRRMRAVSDLLVRQSR